MDGNLEKFTKKTNRKSASTVEIMGTVENIALCTQIKIHKCILYIYFIYTQFNDKLNQLNFI